MNEKQSSIVIQVNEMAQPLASALGLEIWDTEFVKEGSSWFLRIFIDKENGVSIDDCENFSRIIEKKLDEKDFIKQSYYLEVSSPGLERPLKRDSDFIKFLNSRIYIKLYKSVDKIKEFEGILQKYEDGLIYLMQDNNVELKINKSDCSIIRLSPKLF